MKTPRSLNTITLWLCRIAVGITFITSGWAKCVDPWGFVFKIEEYLTVWGFDIPIDIIAVGSVALSLFELLTGIACLTGCLRRTAPIAAAAMMAFMLPLTLYIYIADPVADCGCFGDLIVLSNGATLFKNIIITFLVIILIIYNKRRKSLITPSLQWIALALTGIYGLVIAVIGWNFQPILDFRPFPPGSMIIENADSQDTPPAYLYTKDGVTRSFTLDALPDSTWAFVSAQDPLTGDDTALAIFDGDYDVTDEILNEDSLQGDVLLLVVNNPSIDYLNRARMTGELNDAISAKGGRMIGLVAASGDVLEEWIELSNPNFEIFSSSETALRQLARGNAAIVALRDGRVVWKRSLSTLDETTASSGSPVDFVAPVDNGRLALWLSGTWAVAIMLLIAISHVNRTKKIVVKES